MYTYFVTRPLTLNAAGQRKTLYPAIQAAAPATTEVHLPAQREIELVRIALKATYPEERLHQMLRILGPGALAQLTEQPATLGARCFADPDTEATPNCLTMQLRALKAARPNRRHFRLLLINAFGSNLGDNIIGLTAFRQVLLVLRIHLPEVSVDVLLGWHMDDRLARLFRDIDGIDSILTQGPTLAELSRYQAVFDNSGLLLLPRYGKMPMVDWYLWWLGVDHETVPATKKRNAVAIPDEAREFVAWQLPATDGPRILVNPKASVALRSMPEPATRRLIDHLLATWPKAHVVLVHPLALNHPRVRNLSAEISDVDRLAALVAQVDGLIGVDTYTQHLADATATPAVTLYTSVLPELYPYYPLGESILVPDAQRLPAWGRMKVPPGEWKGIAISYEAAWQALDPNIVLDALRSVMERKTVGPTSFAGEMQPARATTSLLRTHPHNTSTFSITIPRRQRDDPMAAMLSKAIADLAKQVLCPGDTVVHLGSGAGEAALGLGSAVGRHGRLVVFEPRRELHQLLCANLAGAGIHHAETHAVMPEGKWFALRAMNGLRVEDEYLPANLWNCRQPEPVVCWPLDALALKACRMLVVCSPLPLLSCLQGARATLERLRPVVLAGVLQLHDGAVMEAFFAELGYGTRTLLRGDAANPNQIPLYGILIAEPTVPVRA
jgi:hypothetical protein